MSVRLKPIQIPAGVEIQIQGDSVQVKGSKGKLQQHINERIAINCENNVVNFSVINQEEAGKAGKALLGTAKALIRNMIAGVTHGYEKRLQIIGVGYRAQTQGKSLALSLGYSHPINYLIPEGVIVETPSPTEIIVKGIDKRLVGQVAANIRKYRSPEPYKGKGIRYVKEKVIMKEAKKK